MALLWTDGISENFEVVKANTSKKKKKKSQPISFYFPLFLFASPHFFFSFPPFPCPSFFFHPLLVNLQTAVRGNNALGTALLALVNALTGISL